MAELIYNGERIESRRGETIFDAAHRSHEGAVEVASSCRGAGSCRECIVQVTSGADQLTPLTGDEEFLGKRSGRDEHSFRLACQAAMASDDSCVSVETFKRKLAIATSGRATHDTLDPPVYVDGNHVCCNDRALGSHRGEAVLGLAIDVGTTTVVIHVVDLRTGETVNVLAFENPQRFGGSDIMHRISYDLDDPGHLHRVIIAHTNNVLHHAGIEPLTIFAVTVAGNPTMRDLFLGFNVQTIGQSPFMSQTQLDLNDGRRETTSIVVTGKDIALNVHPAAEIYGLPLISHHVGGDMTAVLATIPIAEHDEPFLVIDIGTNTEVVIGNRDRLIAASCAAGPAFEGGRVGCGMAASDGAIEHLRRRNGSWEIETVGNAPARGVCGSGLIDLLAELRTSGEMNEVGRFEHGDRITINNDSHIEFSCADASELAQTKGAIGLGQLVLMRKFGIDASQVGKYYLAGAFANHIDLTQGERIGLFLPIASDRVERIGNASIEGAKAVLLSRACRDRLEQMVKTIEHVSLETEPDFFDLYAEMTMLQPIATE